MSEPIKVRTVTMAEGTFVNVADLKRRLDDKAFLLECAAMIRIAKDLKHPPLLGVKLCILNALDGGAGGALNARLAAAMKQLRQGNEGTLPGGRN